MRLPQDQVVVVGRYERGGVKNMERSKEKVKSDPVGPCFLKGYIKDEEVTTQNTQQKKNFSQGDSLLSEDMYEELNRYITHGRGLKNINVKEWDDETLLLAEMLVKDILMAKIRMLVNTIEDEFERFMKVNAEAVRRGSLLLAALIEEKKRRMRG